LSEFRQTIRWDAGHQQDDGLVLRFSEATARLLDKVNLQCAGER
jgi:hypothetical protein